MIRSAIERPRVGVQAIWPSLPVLLVAGLPASVAFLALALAAIGGALALLPFLVVIGLGPASSLLARVAVEVRAGEPPALRALPALARADVRAAMARMLVVAVPLALALVALEILRQGRSPVILASLGVDLVALGCGAVICPFAHAVAARESIGVVASLRRGAGIAAASPAVVGGLILIAALALLAARLIGPPFLIALPGPLAVLVAEATERVLGARSCDCLAVGER
jgi:hypothetical protein